jgi:hypothetical protein
MSRPPFHRFDVADLQAEMRQILPHYGPKQSERLREVRALNQARVDAALKLRQRPSRVS